MRLIKEFDTKEQAETFISCASFSNDAPKQKNGEMMDPIMRKQEDFFKEALQYENALATVYLVDGEYVRNNMDVNFTEGGHYAVYDFIPEGEIWIDFDVTPSEVKFVIVHETIELYLMLEKDFEYDDAHDEANTVERMLRTKDADVDEVLEMLFSE